jgi:hypothetical protein
VLGAPHLKPAYGDALERALRATVPGMADYCDLDSSNACASCRYWENKQRSQRLGFCSLFTRRMNGRRGPPLPGSQCACRQWAGR